MIIKITNFINRVFSKLFGGRKKVRLGFYGPVNAGKTSLANRIAKDWTGEEMGTVSKVPHETREIQIKEHVKIKRDGKELEFNLVDTPGIATKIDFEDFLKFGLKEKEAKKRAKEATKGIIDAIKWLDDVDCVLVVMDGTENPYSQVNITVLGNLDARKIPVLIVANKMDLKRAKLKKIKAAFPQYKVAGVSALKGKGMDDFYQELFELVR
ncbi:50S ribosome-binding GTPase [archaeon]|nr:50S ribosome-binding GTPase [archaeon]